MGAKEGQKGPSRGKPLNLKLRKFGPPFARGQLREEGATLGIILGLFELVCNTINTAWPREVGP